MSQHRESVQGLGRRARHRVLVVLCVTEIMSWGVLYYALPVMTPAITAETGWTTTGVTGAFSLGIVVSALAGIPAGRLVDRFGPRLLMTVGSVLAVATVAAMATATSLLAFFLAWTLGGVAMACTLYAPAFAALTRWWRRRYVRALMVLTLLAGLASTIFAPLTAALLGWFGWRDSYLVLGAALGLVTIPLHFFGLRGLWHSPVHGGGAVGDEASIGLDPRAIARSRPFVLLTVAIAFVTFCEVAAVIGQVPLLIERGLDVSAAAWVLGLGGVGQVLGRLIYGVVNRHTAGRGRAVILAGLVAVSTVLLGVVPGPFALLVALAMLVGAGRGLFTLLRATAVTDRWGSGHYGRLTGIQSAPAMAATALAPWAGAEIARQTGGYPTSFLILGAVAAVGAVLMVATAPALRPALVPVAATNRAQA